MYMSRRAWMAVLGAASLALAALACGGGAAGPEDAGGGPGGGGGAAGGIGGGGPGGHGGNATGCTYASDCPGDAVCDPSTGACSKGSLACTESKACGPGAVCSDQGICLANQTGGECTLDEDCPRREQCIAGHCGCMGGNFEAEVVVPNVLILLDKSGSMDRDAGKGDTKWNIALRAVEGLLREFEGKIRFGLLLYPADGGCGLGSLDVGVGPESGPEILSALKAASPQGSTPIGAALAQVRTYEGIHDPSRPNYILLLTDGEERCGGDGEAEVEALRGLDPEVKTFVVGFGDGVSASDLEAMAVAGGTAKGGGTAYFQADDEASLNEAFSTIGGMVLSCSYTIDDTGLALTPDEIFVYFDGAPVAHDGEDGWDYEGGSGRIEFRGGACSALQSGQVEDLVIVHGCPVPIE